MKIFAIQRANGQVQDGLKDDEDWEDEANWYKVNPSLGYTVDIERLRDAYREAKQNPADEITFKWLRMNMWVSSTTSWIPYAQYAHPTEAHVKNTVE